MRTFRVLKRSTFSIDVKNLEVRMDILKKKEFVESNKNYFEEYIVWLEGCGNLDGKSIT